MENGELTNALVARSSRVGVHIARTVFLLLALGAVALLIVAVLDLVSGASEGASELVVWARLAFLLIDALGCLTIVVFDYTIATRQARLAARATLAVVVFALVFDIAHSGIAANQLYYALQLVLIIGFVTVSDRELKSGHVLTQPWEISTDTSRRNFIPLNFFNVFWVFFVASFAGLIIELVWHVLTTGEYQDRAGLLWGPFSPIYGFGALLMTVALNRWWNRSKTVIFLVAGTIGAAFEFAVSWWMEKAFGIVAWDYSGTFLNIDGRTNAAYFCAWGLLGLVWIRLLLPDVLKVVDRIPLRWRAMITVIAAMFMIVDGAMTLIALDRWNDRHTGVAPSGQIERYIDARYDDEFMTTRFQTMQIDSALSSH